MSLSAALRRVASMDSALTSTATTRAAPRASAHSPSTPLPHPTSSTRSPPLIRSNSCSTSRHVEGCWPLPNPPRPSSIKPGRSLRSCSDHAWHTLSRSPNVIGSVCCIHPSRRGPPSGRITAILPRARSTAARRSASASSSTAASTKRRASLGATTRTARTPSSPRCARTPATSSRAATTTITTTGCHSADPVRGTTTTEPRCG